MPNSDTRYFSDMVREIRIRTDVEKYVVENVLKAFLEILTEWMLNKIEFNWIGFGIFKTRTIKGHVRKKLRSFSSSDVVEERYFPDTTDPVVRCSTHFKKKFRG